MSKLLSKTFIACVVLAITGLLSSCNIKDEDFKTMESGVVLVLKCSYYELKLPEGVSIYFTDYSEENGIEGFTLDEDSVDVRITSGTGFFVGIDGLIATNAHVASTQVDERDVTRAMGTLVTSIKQSCLEQFEQYKETYEKLCQMVAMLEESGNTSSSTYQDYVEARDLCAQQLRRLQNVYAMVDGWRVSEGEIEYHSVLGVAYNNTYVTDYDDFCDCVLKKADTEHDVAIIQLKDKTTPKGRFVYYVPEKNPLETYSLGERLVKFVGKDKNAKLELMGYNAGTDLALTEDGVKCQRTPGEISQTESDRIMYTIPTLPGSSGSPVVNLRGELVAVNYAGINGTQSFNYGVRVKYLRKLMDEM